MLAVGAACALPAHAEVYKWVDKDGVTHYSDRPAPGAEEVQIAPAQTYQAPASTTITPPPVAPVVRPPTGPAAPACGVYQPAAEEMLSNVPSVTIAFRGPDGATPVLLVNEKRYTVEPGINKLTITPAPRGTYEVKLTYLDSLRKVICTAPVHKFYVRQPSVLNNPARRRPG